jgi:hypothetical protein
MTLHFVETMDEVLLVALEEPLEHLASPAAHAALEEAEDKKPGVMH